MKISLKRFSLNDLIPGGTPLWLRLGAVATVLVGSAVLGWRNEGRLGLVFAGLVVAMALIRWAQGGLVLLVASCLLMPFSIGTGTQTSINLSLILLVLIWVLWLADMVIQRSTHLHLGVPFLPGILLAVVATISFLVGNQSLIFFADMAPLRAQLGGLGIFWLSIAALILIAFRTNSLLTLKRMTWTFLIIGGVYLTCRLLPGFKAIGDLLFTNQSEGNSMFWILMTALAGGQLLFNDQLTTFKRLAFALLLVATLWVAWFQSRAWASGWLPSFTVIAVLIFLKNWRLAVFFGLIAGAGVLLLKPDLVSDLIAGDQYSINTRWVAWNILLTQLLKVSPWIGLGPANYYWYTPLYPILGYRVVFNSHNNYVDVVMQTGVIGMACLGWFMAAMSQVGLRLRSLVSREGGFAKGYVNGMLAALAGIAVAMLLADWFIPFVYNIGLQRLHASLLAWIFLGGLVAIDEMPQVAPKGEDKPADV
jgi:hypothetical protein